MNRAFGLAFLVALVLAVAAGFAPGVTHAQQPAPPSQRPANPAALPSIAAQRPATVPSVPGANLPPVIQGVSVSATLSFREEGARAPEPEVVLLEGRFNTTGDFALRLEFTDGNRTPESSIDVVQVDSRQYFRFDDEDWGYLEDADGRQCGDSLGLPGIITNPLAALRSVGTVQLVGTRRLDETTVQHLSGTLDQAAVMDALSRYLARDPACADQLAGEDLAGEDASTIQYDMFIGEGDGFPYRLLVVIGIPDEGELTVQMDMRPSATPFRIVAPADASPIPGGDAELALPGRATR